MYADRRNVCRTCLSSKSLRPIFGDRHRHERYTRILRAATGQQIRINDGLPQHMCSSCLTTINSIIKYQRKCQQTNKRLNKHANGKHVRQTHQHEREITTAQILEYYAKTSKIPPDSEDDKSDSFSKQNDNCQLVTDIQQGNCQPVTDIEDDTNVVELKQNNDCQSVMKTMNIKVKNEKINPNDNICNENSNGHKVETITTEQILTHYTNAKTVTDNKHDKCHRFIKQIDEHQPVTDIKHDNWQSMMNVIEVKIEIENVKDEEIKQNDKLHIKSRNKPKVETIATEQTLKYYSNSSKITENKNDEPDSFNQNSDCQSVTLQNTDCQSVTLQSMDCQSNITMTNIKGKETKQNEEINSHKEQNKQMSQIIKDSDSVDFIEIYKQIISHVDPNDETFKKKPNNTRDRNKKKKTDNKVTATKATDGAVKYRNAQNTRNARKEMDKILAERNKKRTKDDKRKEDSHLLAMYGNDKQTKRHTCDECHKQFTSDSGYKRHVKAHSGFDLVCQHCSYTCYSKQTLLMHCRAKHGYERKDKCSYCPYTAVKADQIKEHERLHTGERPYMCATCGNTFARFASYRNHLSSHLEKTVKCDQCPALFKSASLMKMHQYRHRTPRRRITYKCVHCDRAYSARWRAVQHAHAAHAARADVTAACYQRVYH